MIKIAHRGNYKGRNVDRENTISYIEEAIAAGYNEIGRASCRERV